MSPPLSFGSLFKRKGKKPPQGIQTRKSDPSQPHDSRPDLNGSEPNRAKTADENGLSISDALNLLRKIEDEKVGDMSRSLVPIKLSLENTLLSIGKLADEMENEQVKVEDEKFKPSVESSRRILVSSLKKEVSSNYPTPTSIPEAQEFKESLQSLMERFGDVSGSHSKLLTTFMKKHTGKIKGEFDVISSLEKRTNRIMEDFEEDRRPVANCITVLNKTSQMLSGIKQQENELERTKSEISRLDVEGHDLSRRLADIERSSDFELTSKTIKEIVLAEEERKEFHKYVIDLFSPVSRALTKYSYGTSKSTSSKLQVLMDAPWNIFEQTGGYKEENGTMRDASSPAVGLESYTSLIVEVQKAVSTGKITLKDSKKTLKSFDLILNSIPDLQRRSELLANKLESLKRKRDDSVIAQAESLRSRLRENKALLDNHSLYLESLENEIKDKKNNLQRMVQDSETCLSQVTGRNYSIILTNGS
ncbi:MAG: hypothetical protein M3297_12245 [Thermoproteota archaeon]|nr:hypothetical protein [Thermoproteota archaeon]